MLEPIWKRKGFKSKAEYEDNLTKEKKGIYLTYDEYLAEQKGFKSLDDYLEHTAKQKGFASRADYEERIAKHKGFNSYSEYLEHLAKEKGFKSYSEYQEYLASHRSCEFLQEKIKENIKNMDPDSITSKMTVENLRNFTGCNINLKKKKKTD